MHAKSGPTHRRLSRVLVIDSTGRGHALCDLLVRTDDDVIVCYGPGNPFARHPRIIPVPSISLTDPTPAVAYCRGAGIDVVVVSYVDALVAGFVDVLRSAGIAVVGPTRRAAALEASKAFMKEFCGRAGLPTAKGACFDDPAKAKAYASAHAGSLVVKADGLCPNGDGAHVCDSRQEAEAAIDRAFADGAGGLVLLEERLRGDEVSVFALLDGTSFMMFPPALDYKRAEDGGRGTNCDGMGSICPHPLDGPELRNAIAETILRPLVRGLIDEGIDYTGFVYVGCMWTGKALKVLEINVRFGDSEAEVVFPAIQSQFTDLLGHIVGRTLNEASPLDVDGLHRCSVALTQGAVPGDDRPGWPYGPFAAGQPITGLDGTDDGEWQTFVAGVAMDRAGTPVTAGGRVVHVVGRGSTPVDARANAYAGAGRIDFPGKRMRSDIGLPDAAAEEASDTASSDWCRSLHQAVCCVLDREQSPLSRIVGDGQDRQREALNAAIDGVLRSRKFEDVRGFFVAADPRATRADADFLVLLVEATAHALSGPERLRSRPGLLMEIALFLLLQRINHMNMSEAAAGARLHRFRAHDPERARNLLVELATPRQPALDAAFADMARLLSSDQPAASLHIWSAVDA